MQAIPGLKKSQEWAAKRAEEARRVQRSHHNPQSPIRTRNGQWIEDEPEQFQEYFSFKEQRVREKERQYIKERAALMKVEEEERKRQEDETRREVERRAVEMYKREQEEIQSQAAEKRENFRRELLKLGLGHEHIQLLLENSNLDFLGDGLKGHSGLPQHRSSSNVSEKAGLTSRPDPKEAGTSSSTDRKWRLGLPRWVVLPSLASFIRIAYTVC